MSCDQTPHQEFIDLFLKPKSRREQCYAIIKSNATPRAFLEHMLTTGKADWIDDPRRFWRNLYMMAHDDEINDEYESQSPSIIGSHGSWKTILKENLIERWERRAFRQYEDPDSPGEE